jgi:C1A family cysteine protease
LCFTKDKHIISVINKIKYLTCSDCKNILNELNNDITFIKFKHYKGGVLYYEEKDEHTNHSVVVVGYGKDIDTN